MRLMALSFCLALIFPVAMMAQEDPVQMWKRIAEDAWKKAWEKVEEEAYADLKDVPSLPRVLLIGDSISMAYTGPTRRLLRGKANVHHPPTNCSSTVRGLEDLNAWLSHGRWDVIHFNWGLHDLIVKAGGTNQVPLDQYEKNLRELVQKLEATGAKLIWAATTPVPDKIVGGPARRNKDAIAYNTAARKIMQEYQIAIDDLYSFALPRMKEMLYPDDVHFTFEGSEVLAKQVADSVLAALGKASSAESVPQK